MSELSEIIEHENKVAQRVLKIKEQAEKEIAKTKQAIEKQLQKSSFLDIEEKEKIEKEKIEKIRQLEISHQKKWQEAISSLKEKANKVVPDAIKRVIEIIS